VHYTTRVGNPVRGSSDPSKQVTQLASHQQADTGGRSLTIQHYDTYYTDGCGSIFADVSEIRSFSYCTTHHHIPVRACGSAYGRWGSLLPRQRARSSAAAGEERLVRVISRAVNAAPNPPDIVRLSPVLTGAVPEGGREGGGCTAGATADLRLLCQRERHVISCTISNDNTY